MERLECVGLGWVWGGWGWGAGGELADQMAIVKLERIIIEILNRLFISLIINHSICAT